MLFDTHSHLNFAEFQPDLDEVILRARESGVSEILVVGTDEESNRRAVAIARAHDLWAAVGAHPYHPPGRPDDPAAFLARAGRDRVVAVGETGLDFTCAVPRETQAAVFLRMLELARDEALPVIIHSREAARETLAALRSFAGGARLAGVWHCFSGDEALAGDVLALGLHISFTGNVTYRKNEPLRRTLAAVPLDRLLLETDCPFLPPEGRRGRRNEPAWLPILARVVAEVKNLPEETVAAETFENSRRLFNCGAPPGSGRPAGANRKP